MKLMKGVWFALCVMIAFWAIQAVLMAFCMFGSLLLAMVQGSKEFPDFQSAGPGMQVFVTIMSTLVITLLFCKIGLLRQLDLRYKGLSLKLWGILILTLAALSQGFSILTEFTGLPDFIEETLVKIIDMPLGMLAISIIGPIGEEVAFRSGIIGHLKRKGWGNVEAIALSALIFGLVHMNPTQIFYASVLGAFLGWVYVRTESVIPCMVLHIVNNTIGVVGSLCMDDPDISAAEYYGMPGAVIVMVCCIILAGSLIWYFLKPQLKVMEPSDRTLPFLDR